MAIETINEVSDNDTLRLLAASYQGPYTHLIKRLGRDGLERLVVQRLRVATESPESKIVSARYRGESAAGLAVLSPLSWDSARLGVECFHLDLLLGTKSPDDEYDVGRRLIQRALKRCDVSGHVSLRVDGKQTGLLHALEDEGFNVMDTLLIFVADPPFQEPLIEGSATIRPSRTDDIKQVKELARSAFALSRWHSDQRIPNAVADDVFSSWAEGCCLDDAGHFTFVAEEADTIMGFISIKLDAGVESVLGVKIGVIELIATAKEARRSGVGTALLAASLTWFRDQRAAGVQVGTQSINTAACCLYERCGFSLAASSYSLTRWLNDD